MFIEGGGRTYHKVPEKKEVPVLRRLKYLSVLGYKLLPSLRRKLIEGDFLSSQQLAKTVLTSEVYSSYYSCLGTGMCGEGQMEASKLTEIHLGHCFTPPIQQSE